MFLDSSSQINNNAAQVERALPAIGFRKLAAYLPIRTICGMVCKPSQLASAATIELLQGNLLVLECFETAGFNARINLLETLAFSPRAIF